MRLTNIRISGFRGIRTTLELPIGSGFTVISGKNGSGKSTVCDAIEYLLARQISRFSESEFEAGERPEDYIWWRGAEGAPERRIEGKFLSDMQEVHTVWVTPEGASDIDKSLFCDAALAPDEPLPLACLTSIFRDELITVLSTDRSETSRAQFVDAAIGSTEANILVKRATSYVEMLQSMARQQQSTYDEVRRTVVEVTAAISEARSVSSAAQGTSLETALQSACSILGTKATELSEVLQEIRQGLSTLRYELDTLERLQHDLAGFAAQMSEIESIRNLQLSLEREVKELETDLAAAEDRSSAANRQLKVEQDSTPQYASLAQLREHGGRLGLQDGRCPLCGSRIEQPNFVAHVKELERQIDLHGRQLSARAREQAERSAEYIALKNQYELKRAEVSRIMADLNALESKGGQLEDRARQLGVNLHSESISKAIESRRNRLTQLEKHLQLLGAFTALNKVAELERQRNNAQEEADAAAQRLTSLSTALQTATTAATTGKRLEGEVLQDRLAQLEPLLSELYVRLRPHVDYPEVKYRMRGDVRHFLRLEVGDNLNPRFLFSSGQRRALGLAFLIAVYLSRPWCKFNTLVLDDPVQHVDDYRALHLAELLSCLRQSGHQIICTTEDPALAGLFCRRLRASEVGEGVRVELDYSPGIGVQVEKMEQVVPLPERVLLSI